MFTIAVTNYFSDNITMLPVKAEIEGIGEVMFHQSPRVDFDGKNIVKNFKVHLDFRLKRDTFHSQLLPNAYFHFPREKRMQQYINIFHSNKQRAQNNTELFIPNFYLSTERHGEHVTVTNFALPTEGSLVIKEQFGARGGQQIVVPVNMLTSLLKHTKGLTMAEVKDKFPDLIYSESTNWDKVFFKKPTELFISDLIPNVKQEWRLLVGGDDIYGREREIKPGSYRQANLELNKFHNVPEVKYEPIENMFDENLVNSLKDFVNFIDLPLGSLDLFLTEDGKYGLFEYSVQYGFHGTNPQFIRQLHLDGIRKVILKWLT